MVYELGTGQSALLTDIAMCINSYRLSSPGLYCCIHAPVELDDGTWFCPDITAMVNHGSLKQCHPEPDYDCFHGPPTSCSMSSRATDLLDYDHLRACYERSGVIEYVALRDTDPVEWIWNRRIDVDLAAGMAPAVDSQTVKVGPQGDENLQIGLKTRKGAGDLLSPKLQEAGASTKL